MTYNPLLIIPGRNLLTVLFALNRLQLFNPFKSFLCGILAFLLLPDNKTLVLRLFLGTGKAGKIAYNMVIKRTAFSLYNIRLMLVL